MRLVTLVLLPSMAIAGSPENQVPRPFHPKGIQFKVPQIPWWNSAEKARLSSPSTFNSPVAPPTKSSPEFLLLPYPYQAPANGRAYFFYQ
jgi:hypothetical protein